MDKTIYVGSGGGYYGGSAILTVRIEDGKTNYEFSPSGWDFDTDSQLEAAAICASSNDSFMKEIEQSELNTVEISEVTNDDLINALYWLTGGNSEWYHGYWAENGVEWNDEAINLLLEDKDIIEYINNAISASKNFTELILNFKKLHYGIDTPTILVCAADTLSELFVYDEEEQEEE
jgi:hypothetical protein